MMGSYDLFALAAIGVIDGNGIQAISPLMQCRIHAISNDSDQKATGAFVFLKLSLYLVLMLLIEDICIAKEYQSREWVDRIYLPPNAHLNEARPQSAKGRLSVSLILYPSFFSLGFFP